MLLNHYAMIKFWTFVGLAARYIIGSIGHSLGQQFIDLLYGTGRSMINAVLLRLLPHGILVDHVHRKKLIKGYISSKYSVFRGTFQKAFTFKVYPNHGSDAFLRPVPVFQIGQQS